MTCSWTRENSTKIADLLWDYRQVIFYGPPDRERRTSPRKLAEHLTKGGGIWGS